MERDEKKREQKGSEFSQCKIFVLYVEHFQDGSEEAGNSYVALDDFGGKEEEEGKAKNKKIACGVSLYNCFGYDGGG